MRDSGFRTKAAVMILGVLVAGLMTLQSSDAKLSPLATPSYIQVSREAGDQDDTLFGVRSVYVFVQDAGEKYPSGLSPDMLKLLVARRLKDRSGLEVTDGPEKSSFLLLVRVSATCGEKDNPTGWAFMVELFLMRPVIIPTGEVSKEGFAQGYAAPVKVWDVGRYGFVGGRADPVGSIEEAVEGGTDEFILAWYRANK